MEEQVSTQKSLNYTDLWFSLSDGRNLFSSQESVGHREVMDVPLHFFCNPKSVPLTDVRAGCRCLPVKLKKQTNGSFPPKIFTLAGGKP